MSFAGIAAMMIQRHPLWSPSEIKSAIVTTARTTSNKGTPITTSSGFKATPWAAGAGLADAQRVLNPGLTFHTSYRDYVSFLAGQSRVRTRLTFYTPVKLTPIKGYQLNLPSIVVSRAHMRRHVAQRVVRNVDFRPAVYRATVAAPAGVDVRVFPSSFRILPGMARTFKVVLETRVTAARGGFLFGSITWSDSNGHSVTCILGIQPVRVGGFLSKK